MQERIKDQVRQFIQKNFIFDERRSLMDDESLLGSGIIDSTGILELIAFLERDLLITFNDDDLTGENFDTLNRIAAFASASRSR